MLCLMQHMRRIQQRLGRDAADVQAGATQRVATFDAGGLKAKLGTANGADIAAGAATDDDHVIVSHWGLLVEYGAVKARMGDAHPMHK